MTDMIVALSDLPVIPPLVEGYELTPAKTWDREVIVDWVRDHFGTLWSSEVANGLGHHPCRVLIARRGTEILGFACFDVTFPGFFGPTGVAESARGLGLGKALLLDALHRLRARGYVYAFIGDPGPIEFYQRTVGAVALPESLTSGYSTPLKRQ
ncbi:GNAT family N-acetyltransferase [Saccharospirillum alexandrii]|uniref:GNAT family N-acetyltransferase n=1 Tax=Saccharospirillum alexandrii TaxID=2448477 RepID=UPI000FDCBDFF|nr:GNAT family N-acetyltransferase [Saccharospirillum alexandrii]